VLQGHGVYAQPFVFVTAGYLLAALLRSWSRGSALTREATRLRDQAAWLEQRTSLARELHDVVGHHVTAMVVQAEAGQLGPDPAAALQAIADIARHANATAAWVELVRIDGLARLRVSDDGIGPPRAATRGSGLLGIEERVNALGGRWHLHPRPGGGTLLEVVLPVARP
jgi:signal transduction histidine kinase